MAQALRFWIRAPHLSAALVALLLASMLTWLLFDRLHIERRLAFVTASEMLTVKDQGLALQKQAFENPRLLPAYGSSEFANDFSWDGRLFFARFPTGFELFTVGKAGSTPLIIAERLAALGDAVRGRKVVVVLSPTWFIARNPNPNAYAGNFSALQAAKLAFESPISLPLKREFARAMLGFPKTLDGHALLRLELEHLANPGFSLEDRVIEAAGHSETDFLLALDHLQTVFALPDEAMQKPPKPHHSKPEPDWQALETRAATTLKKISFEAVLDGEKSERAEAADKFYHSFQGPRRTFARVMNRSEEWQHLEILLKTLHELGARPLLLNIPANAKAFEKAGVSASDLEAYYTRLENEVRPYGFPLVTLKSDQEDPAFFLDTMGHPSAKGWVKLNEVIDEFYHDTLPAKLE
jgi:D-alanine transfer protein